ncbi:MAG: AbrB/MazE/SpoVT family DNA-binding domain-containing protein [Dehalococcoidia bacterium]|nr:AbrB/MazE/SpoVT family DNA-binding domain-containing protein [Dehalococcoidia bacterium]
MKIETVKVARRGQITLPASLRNAAHIEEGDYIQFFIEGATINLIVKKLIDKSQTYFWTREWQEGECEANEDIRAGRLKTFDSVDELIAELKS